MIEVNDLELTYPNGHPALREVNLKIEAGEFAFLVGSTGSGKSSLLKLFYRELTATRGAVTVGGVDLSDLARHEIPYLRRRIGVIFQDFRLLANKTASENVAYALEITGTSKRKIPGRVAQALELVGLADKAKRLPGQLSGGEQQRVAIARGLVNRPPVILADEPTAPLDSERAMAVIRILNEMARKFETAVIVVTHDEKIIPTFRRIYHIRDGVTHEEAGEGRAIA